MSLARKTVVVAEDEMLIRMSAVEALEQAGFGVIEAEHAEAVLQVFQLHAETIHLLFSDIHMPGEMNGLRLAHHIRLHWPHVALLLASGEMRPTELEMPEGCVFVAKPYDLDHVAWHARHLTRKGVS